MDVQTRLILLAGTSALLLVAGGCQKHVGGQVIAVVNGDEITQQQFNAELNVAKLPAGADKKAAMAQVLQGLVDRKLLVQQAKAEGIEKSPEYLEQVMRMQDTLAVDLLVAKQSKKIATPDKAAIAQFIAANPIMFNLRKHYTLEQIAFPANADAKTIHDLEPTHSLDAIAGVLKAHGIAFKRGTGQMDSAKVPKAVADRIAALPPGEPFIVPSNGAYVASVITASTATPTPDDEAAPIAFNLLRQKSVTDAMQAKIAAAKATSKIEYAQGFAPKPK